MADGLTDPEAAKLYDRDTYAWAMAQADALRAAGPALPAGPDWDNIIEEIECLGRSERASLASRLTTIMVHLLKIEFARDREPDRGWRLSIVEQRDRSEQILDESPSLRRHLPDLAATVAPRACARAAKELNLYGDTDAARRAELAGQRYTPDQLLSDWWPGDSPG